MLTKEELQSAEYEKYSATKCSDSHSNLDYRIKRMLNSRESTIPRIDMVFNFGLVEKKDDKLKITFDDYLHDCKEVTMANFFHFLADENGHSTAHQKKDFVKAAENTILYVITSNVFHKQIESVLHLVEKEVLGIETGFSGVYSRNDKIQFGGETYENIVYTSISLNPAWFKTPAAFYIPLYFIRLAPYFDMSLSLSKNLKMIFRLNDSFYEDTCKTLYQFKPAYPILKFLVKKKLKGYQNNKKTDFDFSSWQDAVADCGSYGPTSLGEDAIAHRMMNSRRETVFSQKSVRNSFSAQLEKFILRKAPKEESVRQRMTDILEKDQFSRLFLWEDAVK